MRKVLLVLTLLVMLVSCQKEASYERQINDKDEQQEDNDRTDGTRLVKWIQGVDFITHNAARPDTVFKLKYNTEGDIIQITTSYGNETNNSIYDITYNSKYPSILGSGGVVSDRYTFDNNGHFIEKKDMSGKTILAYDADGILLSKTLFSDNGNPFSTKKFQIENGNILKVSDDYIYTYSDKTNPLKDILILNCFTNRFGLTNFFGIPEMFVSKNLPNGYTTSDGNLNYKMAYTFNEKGLLVKAVAYGESYGSKKQLTLSFFYE